MNHYTTTTTAPAEKLWCIHIPGPDDLFAAPDQQTAQKMADKHNAAMREYIEKNKLSWGMEMITAEVIEWPHDGDESHAEALLEFDPAEWGFGQPSPKHGKKQSPAALRSGQHGEREVNTTTATPTPEALAIAVIFKDFAIDHTPDGWPAVKQMHLNAAAAELERQHAEIERLTAENKALRAKIELITLGEADVLVVNFMRGTA